MRRRLPLLALATVLAGCGSAGPSKAPEQAGPGPAVSATATRPAPSTTGAGASTATTGAGRSPASATTTKRKPRSPAVTTPAVVPTTTTPVNLPPAKKRKGPRSLSVAEASHAIEPSHGRSAAEQLVDAWKHHAVPSSDPNAVLVQRHLSSLARKCIEPEAVIAGYVRLGIQKYRNYGVIESPVEFARALDSAVPPGRSNCKGILRTLLAQVEQG